MHRVKKSSSVKSELQKIQVPHGYAVYDSLTDTVGVGATLKLARIDCWMNIAETLLDEGNEEEAKAAFCMMRLIKRNLL